MRQYSLFLRRHGFFVGFHLDTMPFAGFFDPALFFGFRLFSGNAARFGFAGDDCKVALGFFGFAASGKDDSKNCGHYGGQDDVSHFSTPLFGICERVFPFGPTTGKPIKEVISYGV